MKSEYQQLRDILDAVRYPVDTRHEADFRAILLGERKRGRRNVLWFFLCCAGMLMAGYGIVSSLGDFPAANRFFGTESAQESSTFRSATSQENAAISIEQQNAESIELESQVTENTNTDTRLEGSSEGKDKGSFGSNSANSNNSTRSQESVTLNTKSGKHNKQSTENLTENLSKSSKQAAETSATNESTSQPTPSISNALEPASVQIDVSDSDITAEEQNLRAVQSENPHRTQLNHSDELLNTTATELSVDDRKVSEKTTIIPSGRRIHFNKIHYGVSTAWFPVGSLLKKVTLKTGYGYQIGGYATYRVTPRTLLRADAGFSRLNGGFTYIKQSSSQQFGFSVVNQNHILEVEKLYTAYASGEIGVKRGKNVFSLGVLGQYLYGARGDIESTVQGQTETPVVTVSNDVWLSTKDINKFSLQGTVSVRSHLTRRIQIAAMVRIPIINTVRIPNDNPLYAFQVKSHGISPQLSMSYQINQQ